MLFPTFLGCLGRKVPRVLRDLTPRLVNMSEIIVSQQLFSHVISLASCPAKCQALNVFVFALVVLRSYWNPSGDLFCIKLLADGDVEKKQVETERELWTASRFILIADSLSGLAASKLPAVSASSPLCFSVLQGNLLCACLPPNTPRPCCPFLLREACQNALSADERKEFLLRGRDPTNAALASTPGHQVKGAPKGKVHGKYQDGCGARRCRQPAFSCKQSGRRG